MDTFEVKALGFAVGKLKSGAIIYRVGVIPFWFVCALLALPMTSRMMRRRQSKRTGFPVSEATKGGRRRLPD